jgi:hypothetical protein
MTNRGKVWDLSLAAIVEGKKIDLTPESIRAVCQENADRCLSLIESAEKGEFHVNDFQKYREAQLKHHKKWISGEVSSSISLVQQVLFHQEGICPAILP